METHTDNTLQATSNQLAAIQLSPHFTLGEMLTLDRHPANLPSLQAVVSLAYGCQLILEPVRQEVGPIIINSGFRTPEVNHQVGGVKGSQHLLGQAADLRPQDPRQFERLVALLRRHALTSPTNCSPAAAGSTSRGSPSACRATTSPSTIMAENRDKRYMVISYTFSFFIPIKRKKL